MDKRTLQMIQRGLIAAVSIVLALIVITAFRDLLEPPDETLVSRTTTTAAPDEGDDIETTTTTLPGETTTSTTSGAVTPAICIDEAEESDSVTVLRIYFPCGGTDLAIGGTYVYREVPATDLVLTTTLREMGRGLEDDEADLGFRSPIPSGAEDSFRGVSIVEGTAYVEFSSTDIFPAGVATAEGVQVFVSTLNANVFQFSTISAVEYRLNGSCDAFWQQLGAEECNPIARSDWQSQLAP